MLLIHITCQATVATSITLYIFHSWTYNSLEQGIDSIDKYLSILSMSRASVHCDWCLLHTLENIIHKGIWEVTVYTVCTSSAQGNYD